jgi:hypothetical protein
VTGQRGRLQRLEGQRLQQEAAQTEAQTYPTSEALEQMTLEQLAAEMRRMNQQSSPPTPLGKDALARLKAMTPEEVQAEYEAWGSTPTKELP